MLVKCALLSIVLFSACSQQATTTEKTSDKTQMVSSKTQNTEAQPQKSQPALSQTEIESDANLECNAIRNLLNKSGDNYRKALAERSQLNDKLIQKYKDDQLAMNKRQSLVESCMNPFRDQLRTHNEKPEIKKIQQEYNQSLGKQGSPAPKTTNGQKRSGPALIDPKQNNQKNAGGPDVAPKVGKVNCDGDAKCVTISGQVEYDGPVKGTIRIDVLQRKPGKAPVLMHNMVLEKLGSFDFQVPVKSGNILLTGFIDKANDGPSADDPIKLMQLQVEESPLTNVKLIIKESGGGIKFNNGPNRPPAK